MVKKYIIMAGGDYEHWKKPRHLSIILGEEVIARTIRLLRENGITDISISSDNPIFEKFDVPILKHDNYYHAKWHNAEGNWYDCFYPTNEPVCYILGDVYFSEDAIKTIVNTDTDDIELFGSTPPFADNYIKDHIEAFALKVNKVKHFKYALEKTKQLDAQGKFWRKPIIWEVWTVIKNVPLQTKADDYIYNYTAINDYTCDIDWESDINKMELVLMKEGGNEMVKLEAIESFTLGRFNEITIVERKGYDQVGLINVGDIFTCKKDLADYLLGNNKHNKPFVKVLEVIPEKVEEPKKETSTIKPIKKTTKRISKK